MQDLRHALQKTRSELQSKEAALKESEAEKRAAAEEKDRFVEQLNHSLQDKELQLQVHVTHATQTHWFMRAHISDGVCKCYHL